MPSLPLWGCDYRERAAFFVLNRVKTGTIRPFIGSLVAPYFATSPVVN